MNIVKSLADKCEEIEHWLAETCQALGTLRNENDVLKAENQRLRDCITALMPFLMEDYEGGVMTAEYKAAIELAIAATGTEARHAS